MGMLYTARVKKRRRRRRLASAVPVLTQRATTRFPRSRQTSARGPPMKMRDAKQAFKVPYVKVFQSSHGTLRKYEPAERFRHPSDISIQWPVGIEWKCQQPPSRRSESKHESAQRDPLVGNHDVRQQSASVVPPICNLRHHLWYQTQIFDPETLEV